MIGTLDYAGPTNAKPRSPRWAVLTALIGCPLEFLIAFVLGFEFAYGSIRVHDQGACSLIGAVAGAIGGLIVAAIGWACPRHGGKIGIIGLLIIALAVGVGGIILGVIGSGLNGV